jgi:hypothetical protein
MSVEYSKVRDRKIRPHKPRGKPESVYVLEVTGGTSKKIF